MKNGRIEINGRFYEPVIAGFGDCCDVCDIGQMFCNSECFQFEEDYEFVAMKLAEVCASSAVSFADALIAELRKQPNRDTIPENQPDKKEVAIGETVEYNGEHLLCVEKTDNEDCSGCAFLAEDNDCKFGPCYKEYRSDGKNVIFVKGGK